MTLLTSKTTLATISDWCNPSKDGLGVLLNALLWSATHLLSLSAELTPSGLYIPRLDADLRYAAKDGLCGHFVCASSSSFGL